MAKINKVLIVKTSSLGDVIHTLPAITDVYNQYPNIKFDWLVEEAFCEIPHWHPAVDRVIPVAIRRWRKNLWQPKTRHEWRQCKHILFEQAYDYVIDAQGLFKSAWLSCQAKGIRCGFDYHSAREPLASLCYQQRYQVKKQQHAVTRIRELFAHIFNYPTPQDFPNYNIQQHFAQQQPISHTPYVVFLHGTTWESKHWIESYWIALAEKLAKQGYAVHLPWGNQHEYARATKIAAIHPNIMVLPKLNLTDIANELAHATIIVGVDTGLSHLAAALDRPTITLYSATEPAWTGTFGYHQIHLQTHLACSPCLKKHCHYDNGNAIYPSCFQEVSVTKVWAAIESLL